MSLKFVAPALVLVAFVASGCGKIKDANDSEAPLTKFEADDFSATLEDWSVAQSATADFGSSSHPSASKPSYQQMSTQVRAGCSIDVQRLGTEVRSATAKGGACPIAMNYSLAVNGLGNREQRTLNWTYDQVGSQLKNLNSIEKVAVQGRQITEGRQQSWNVTGHVVSSRFGNVDVQIEGSVKPATVDQYKVNERYQFKFPRFTVALSVETSASGAGTNTIARMNGRRLSDDELASLSKLMPRLGVGIR